jgi:hypothetical protein
MRQPGEVGNLIADFKETCSACSGGGVQVGYAEIDTLRANIGGKCLYCGGKGYTLTQLGEDLFDLYRPLIQELIRDEFKRRRQD